MHPVRPDEREVAALFVIYNDDLTRIHDVLIRQFSVLQSRTQLLLTLATITLTITGFSGPRIAGTHAVIGWLMGGGLLFVLASIALVLTGTLRLRFASEILDPARPRESVTEILCQRNRKTRIFLWSLALLVIGLSGYVAAVIAYLVIGDPASVTLASG
jgi:uncharacterized membrane protein